MSERWIIIPGWDNFQHRDMARSSVPPWIKNLTRLLGDTDYLALTQAQRGLLHGLWLMYASHRRVVNESAASRYLVGNKSDAKYFRVNLDALNHAGWIELSASKPDSRYASDPASLEVEVEVESFKKTPKSARAQDRTSAAVFAVRTMIANGAITDLVDLEAEITASAINGEPADHLRTLIAEKRNGNGNHGHSSERIPFSAIADTQPDEGDA